MKRKLVCFILLVCMLAAFAFGCTQSEKAKIKSLDDINNADFNLGVPTGSNSETAARELFPNAQVTLVNSVADGVAAVSAGKVDGFAFDEVVLQGYCQADDTLTLMDETFGESGFYIGMAKGNEDLLKSVNTVIETLKEDGTLDDMEKRWIDGTDRTMPNLTPPENPVGTLRILTDAAVVPFGYISEDAECIGYDIELGMRIAYALNMDYSVIVMNFESIIPSLTSGRGDVIISNLTYTDERAEQILFSEPYIKSYSAILLLKERYAGASDSGEEQSEGSFIDEFVSDFTGTFITEGRWKLFISGIEITVIISVAAFILGTILALVLCAMLSSQSSFCRGFAAVYGKIVTGIPILVWLMILYYMVFRNVDIPAILVAIIGFGLETGASLSGVFKTGLDSVDKGQIEAATALGFMPFDTFRRIVFPQAAARIFNLYMGQFVSLVKSTSIVGYIAIMDLTKVSDIVRTRTYQAFFPLIATALIYFGVTSVFIELLKLVQRRLNPKLRKNVLKGVKTR
jgi:polar amino acid transport system substrate-binding protein